MKNKIKMNVNMKWTCLSSIILQFSCGKICRRYFFCVFRDGVIVEYSLDDDDEYKKK